MSGKALRKRSKRERQAARRRGFNHSTPFIVATAFVASTAMGRASLYAETLASAVTLTNITGIPATGEQAARRFEIPEGNLGDVIAAFEKSTGMRVELPEGVRQIHSPGATGVMTEREALQSILEGTSLTGRFISSTLVSIEFRTAAETVDVTGATTMLESPKYTQPLRDVPQTINVIKQDLLQQQGATTLRDALRNVTGITFQAGEGGTPAGDQLTIRGFSARTDMFVDGVRDTGGYSRDTFNLEQVEVAKGPSSAIAGRGSTGGSINLVSKAPRLAESIGAGVDFGSADMKRGTLDYNSPIKAIEGAAFRLNAMWNDSGVAGRDIVEDNRWAVAPTLAFGLRKPTRFTLSYLHMNQDNQPDYGLPWVPVTNTALAEYAGGPAPTARNNWFGLVNRDFEKIKNDLGTAQIDHTFSRGTNLRNLTRYGSTDRDSVITPPRFVSDTSTDIRRTDVKSRDQNDGIFANQTSLTSRLNTGSISHDMVAGFEVSRETSTNYARAEVGPNTPTSPNTSLFDPNPYDIYTATMAPTGAYTDATANSAAGYAFDTAHLGPQWQLTGGLRWDRFDVDYDSISTAGVHAPLGRTDEMVSGRVGLVYKPREAGSLYAGWASSFNPSAEGLALTTSTVNIEPEKTYNYEAGVKWDLSEARLSVNGAAFRTEKTNARTPGVNPGDPPTVLAGKQVVNGIELGMSGTITPKWSAFASYSYMQSDIAQSNTPAEVDQALAFVPENTFNIWTTYDLTSRFKAGGGAQFMDAVYRNATNTISVPSYWVVNALVEYSLNDHLTLRLNGNNLGNTEYIDRVGGGHYVPGPSRSVVFGTSVGF